MKLRSHLIKGAAVAALAVVALAGCSNSGNGDGGQSQAPITAAPPASQPQGAIADLQDKKCSVSADGVWSGSGKVKNQSNQKRTYVVKFSVIKSDTYSVLNSETKEVVLEPGKESEVKFDKLYSGDGAKDATCVQSVTLK